MILHRGLVAALCAACTLAPGGQGGSAVQQVAPDRAWDEVFTREQFWNGGDIAHSIDLADGRVLWLFGDSIFGPVREGKRIGGASKMLRAGIAWHAVAPEGAPPPDGSVLFASPEPFVTRSPAATDTRDTRPTDVPVAAGPVGAGPVASWLMASPDLWPQGTWYWWMNDGVLVGDRFVLFTTAIGPAGNPDGMWNFRRVGGAILTVENPGDAPDAWRAVQTKNPLVTATAKFGEKEQEAENWGLAIVRENEATRSDGETSAPHGETFFLYGVRSVPGRGQSLLAARASATTLARPESWEFFDGARWTSLADDHAAPRPSDDQGGERSISSPAGALCEGLVDEFTVERMKIDTGEIYVLVQSEPMLGRHVLARTARRPEGPWSPPKAVYEVKDLGPGGMTYAAKGHAVLSRPGELLVTYVVNAGLGRVFGDAGLYRPRFVRVPVEMLPRAP